MPLRHRQSGFSLPQLLLGGACVPIAGLAIYFAMTPAPKPPAAPATATAERLRAPLRRIADELSTSSAIAEDRNGNGILDAGEDLNHNRRLDSDWSIDGDAITFNRLQPDGTYSLPITYRLANGRLERVVTLATGAEQTATLASQVTAFEVATAEDRITVTMAIRIENAAGDPEIQSASITAELRQ